MEEQIVKQVAVAPHSVEIGRNAKGEVSFGVKVYGESADDAATKAIEIAKRLKAELAA